MDLETENRIAAILLREAAELRRQAEKDGVQVYLEQPKIRGRPNSRFLTATVRGVQQSNQAVEENEMWQARQKELELDDRLRGRIRDEGNGGQGHRKSKESGITIRMQPDIEGDVGPSGSSRKRANQGCYLREDEGLKDDEVDEFLHSRVKRGRGAVGSRMDETGPYLPSSFDTTEKLLGASDVDRKEGLKKNVVLGPGKPSSLVSWGNSEEAKKAGSSKQRSTKHKSKDKSRNKDKKKKKRTREEKRSKHRLLH